MAYFVAVVSAWMIFTVLTALRPGRHGIFLLLALPVGLVATALAAPAIALQVLLLGVLDWWGFPRTEWLTVLVWVLAAVAVAANLALVVLQFQSRCVVRRALARSPREPLDLPRPHEDRFGTWWRTALQISFHPRDMQLVSNIRYGPLARHRLDIWRMSTTPQGAPVMFFVHGGSWSFGDKNQQGRPMLHEFVRRGWIVVSINYRFAPKNPWPAQIEDATRALGWTKKFIANYGGDPRRVVVAGASAGGQLSSLLALTADDPTWRPKDMSGVDDWSVRGAISLYGVLEMTGDEKHWHGFGRGLLYLLERRVVQKSVKEEPALFRAMSPYHRITIDAPPFLVVHGGNDTLVDVHVARDFVEEFRRVALSRIYYVELPFTQHAFDLVASPRVSSTVRAAVVFAESISQSVPPLSTLTLASYQVPPTRLTVELSSSRSVEATQAARELGPYWVVSADNPHSTQTSDGENDRRRAELESVLDAHGVTHRPSIAKDPTGRWPDERGFAVFGVAAEFARALAKAFDQFAFYFVDDVAVQVRRCDVPATSAIDQRHRD